MFGDQVPLEMISKALDPLADRFICGKKMQKSTYKMKLIILALKKLNMESEIHEKYL